MTSAAPAGSLIDESDLHLFSAGRHRALHDHLGAHVADVDGANGTWFSVWAPAAERVAVVGDFNGWEANGSQLVSRGASGVWEAFVPGSAAGHRYRFEITTTSGEILSKADPMAFQAESAPATASVVHQPGHLWHDESWRATRADADLLARPMSIYEVHLGSWRHPRRGGGELGYRELAEQLADYTADMGFTHVELMPVMAHPFGGSWGYQVTSYFAPSPRWGSPDDFAALVDHLHGAGVGVILDWVPAHFPRDDWSLGHFDGTALYEHEDALRAGHPDWGTLVFDYGRNEVRSFLLSNAAFWLDRYHVDGIRVDAVASMLYLDYSRRPGEWVPNRLGGREDLDAVDFVRALNAGLHDTSPGVLSVAEESTAWPGVCRPTEQGGLGFSLKWDLGWMHDTLAYFAEDPTDRTQLQRLTFSFSYALSERFVLPLSHDEVVHGKGSLLAKMPGDERMRFANLRALYGLMWAHPGKPLLFMGGELAQEREWSHERELDWHLLDDAGHAGIQRLVRDLNHRSHVRPALWAADFEPEGFAWLVGDDLIATWSPSCAMTPPVALSWPWPPTSPPSR
ncbi:MAG: 1,4-alpha-glucan branching protein GlgB [Acidimicrobiales bacterium]